MLYTLNLYSFISQLYLNKAGKKQVTVKEVKVLGGGKKSVGADGFADRE